MRFDTAPARVSIIILNWNGLDDTIECLESLKKIDYPNYSISVADNGSEHGDADLLKKKYGNFIRVIEYKTNLGFAEGNNRAITILLGEGQSDFILLLNNDTVVRGDFLSKLVDVALRNETIGIIGSKNYFYTPERKTNRIWCNGAKIAWWQGSIKHFQKERHVPADMPYFDSEFVVGSAMLIRTSVFKTVGLLDPSYFCYGEDGDFCLRAKKHGYQSVYAPASVIWHKINQSLTSFSPNYTYLVTRNKFWLIKRNFIWFKYGVFVIVFLAVKQPLWVARFLWRGNFLQIFYFYRGIIDGLMKN
ncbi:MAG: glycosyltransferase family 2 protein [Patescibacteria group bacterium]